MAFAIGGEAEYYEPPDPGPECLWCDGTKIVEVGSIITAGGESMDLQAYFHSHNTMVTCLRCDGTGIEPRPEQEER